MENIKFGGRILKKCRTAFERQVEESVEIQNQREDGHYILNSKAECNRCALPRLTTKLGEVSVEELEKRKKRREKEKRKSRRKNS